MKATPGAATVAPLYATPQERETIAAGLRAANRLMLALGEQAVAAELPDVERLMVGSAEDYLALARRIERGELDELPEAPPRVITILELAEAKGAQRKPDGSLSADELARVGFDVLGGCCRCGASIAAYNAYPGRNGYWHCGDCIDGDGGFADVAEYDQHEAKGAAHG